MRESTQEILNSLAGVDGKTSQQAMNVLAGTNYISEQEAANKWAGTTGKTIQEAINTKAGTKSAPTREALQAIGNTRKNYITVPGTLIESFETIGEWTRGGAAGSISEDTTHVDTGSKSLAITFASGTSVFYDKTISMVIGGGSNSTVLNVWIPSLTDLGSVALYISSTSGFTKYFSRTIAVTSLHEGYNRLVIDPSEWTNSGSESWSNTMIRLRIRVNATTGTPSATFCSLYAGVAQRPKVLVTFDDSWESQYSKAYSYMNSIGLTGTIYAIGSKIGTANYMTAANLDTVYAAGWDIGNHGSVDLTSLGTQSEQETEINNEASFITAYTRSNKHYAYPFGGYNDNARAALAKLGYATGRTIIDRPQANFLDERYLLTRYGVYNTTSVATTKGYIDKAIAQGTAVLLNYHLIVDSTADVATKVLTADFNEVMDYIKTKRDAGLIDCVTISEWYNGLDIIQKY
jgi:peptidoglycan/xylan/chitin deacetylase (PgdA/CDA1 family)